jgi:hypothetical protein
MLSEIHLEVCIGHDEVYSINIIASWRFSPDTPVSSTNKTNRHEITEILLKEALNTINLNHRKLNGHVSG